LDLVDEESARFRITRLEKLPTKKEMTNLRSEAFLYCAEQLMG
jgi:hypothetical protein